MLMNNFFTFPKDGCKPVLLIASVIEIPE